MIDTHTHIYLEEFDDDRAATVQRAVAAGVRHIVLPNVDAATVEPMKALHDAYPGYTSMAMGLHPTSVTEDDTDFLAYVEAELATGQYVAVGEVGIDLYWDDKYEAQQLDVFAAQIRMALRYNLPVIVHLRNAVQQAAAALAAFSGNLPVMIFHSFTGTADDVSLLRKACGSVEKVFFGVNGIVTFKNSHLDDTVKAVGVEHLLMETDSPYLAPVPYRGKRNETSFIPAVYAKVAEILNIDIEQLERVTDNNAINLFGLPQNKVQREQ